MKEVCVQPQTDQYEVRVIGVAEPVKLGLTER